MRKEKLPLTNHGAVEAVLSACAWLDLKLITFGVDPLFSYPEATSTIEARRYGVYVIDADTIRVGDIKVRLNGIPVPERDIRAFIYSSSFLKLCLNCQ